ncbi:MAG: rhomboid family intramembrane serine protease [Planctomycetota bacterium]|jgi:rhomboid protease GluP|nr:rhomboid family intramembrane serine protease [Planctomycetota bacterium]
MADWYYRNRQQHSIRACPGCGNLVRSNLEYCPYCTRQLGPGRGWKRLQGLLPQTTLLTGKWPYTRLLLTLLALVFVLQFVTDFFIPAEYRFSSGGFSLAAQAYTNILMGSNFHLFDLAYGQVWRFVTSCFLHFGLLHIVFNGWAMWDLGRMVEERWGGRQVFTVFILAGAAGSAASLFWYTLVWKIPTNSAGASGAICGLLGIMLGAYYRNRFSLGQFLGQQLVRWAIYILLFGLVLGADNGAHVGGFLVGAGIGYLFPPGSADHPGKGQSFWRLAFAASLAISLLSLVFALVFYLRGYSHVALLLNQLTSPGGFR